MSPLETRGAYTRSSLPGLPRQFFSISIPSPTSSSKLPMSQVPSSSTSSSSSNFLSIFNAALKAYEKKTKKDLLAHPLAAQLQACNSPGDILAVLQDKVKEFDQSRSSDERLSRWLNPTISVLYAFSATLGQGVGLVSPIQSTLSIPTPSVSIRRFSRPQT